MRSEMAEPFRLGRSAWMVAVFLALTLLVFETTSLDLRVQDHFFDFARGVWWVDGRAPGPRLWFYDGPKLLLIVVGVAALTLAVGPARWRARWTLERPGGRVALFSVLATLATGPALIGFSKATTNVFCPSEITRYGGDVPYVRVFEAYPPGARPERKGRCFPAGHASGGFALLSLAGLARTRRGQVRGILVGIAAGGAMGGYQMLKGAHYLSHTLITAAALWLVFLGWRAALAGIAGRRHQVGR